MRIFQEYAKKMNFLRVGIKEWSENNFYGRLLFIADTIICCTQLKFNFDELEKKCWCLENFFWCHGNTHKIHEEFDETT